MNPFPRSPAPQHNFSYNDHRLVFGVVLSTTLESNCFAVELLAIPVSSSQYRYFLFTYSLLIYSAFIKENPTSEVPQILLQDLFLLLLKEGFPWYVSILAFFKNFY